MSLRCLRILILPILAFSVSSYAQSVAEVARQTRAELLQNGGSHLKVYTNDDVISPKPAPAASTGDESAEAGRSASGATQGTESAAGTGKKNGQSGNDATNEHAEKELKDRQRADAINQQYVDKIAKIRNQIEAAQQNIAKLQQDQIESTNLFRQSAGVAPSIPEYEQQMRFLDEQIAAQRDLIVSLKSQLDDTQEAAHRAGVPHAYDY